jgi:hypothetical protein
MVNAVAAIADLPVDASSRERCTARAICGRASFQAPLLHLIIEYLNAVLPSFPPAASLQRLDTAVPTRRFNVL